MLRNMSGFSIVLFPISVLCSPFLRGPFVRGTWQDPCSIEGNLIGDLLSRPLPHLFGLKDVPSLVHGPQAALK